MRKHVTRVFSEPPVDVLYKEQSSDGRTEQEYFPWSILPGQFDQRADSAVQCVQFLNEDEEPVIRTATTYVIEGNITDEEFDCNQNITVSTRWIPVRQAW